MEKFGAVLFEICLYVVQLVISIHFLLCFSHQQRCAEKKRDMEKGFRERLSDTKNSAIVTNLLLSGTFFESDIFATGSLDSAISMLKTYRNFKVFS